MKHIYIIYQMKKRIMLKSSKNNNSVKYVNVLHTVWIKVKLNNSSLPVPPISSLAFLVKEALASLFRVSSWRSLKKSSIAQNKPQINHNVNGKIIFVLRFGEKEASFMASVMPHEEDKSTYCYLNIIHKHTYIMMGLIIRKYLYKYFTIKMMKENNTCKIDPNMKKEKANSRNKVTKNCKEYMWTLC